MEADKAAFTISPGHSLGFLSIGASLQSVLTALKARTDDIPSIDVHYSHSSPLSTPIVVGLPKNGLRLRFDAQEQRLRCIEVLDFVKIAMAYKGAELCKITEHTAPAFRRIYQLLGATFPGEYLAPRKGEYTGVYILSWPGIAFTFPMQHSAWSPSKDHVSLLGSHAAGPALSMVVFEGKNWPQACSQLFTYQSTLPRNLTIASRPKEFFSDEVELAVISANGGVELQRKAPSPPFHIIINRTTPQDLITELGPPDATYRRDTGFATPDQSTHRRTDSTSKTGRRTHSGSAPSSYSSTATDTYETDFDSEIKDDELDRATHDMYWSYFEHGMDILVGLAAPPDVRNRQAPTGSTSVVTKVVIHGNVPGTYAFNRHRRLRWQLALTSRTITSESVFETESKPTLLKHFVGIKAEAEMIRGKVVNRTWGMGPTDSTFFLPDAGEELIEGTGSEQWLGNTRLFHFPGLTFEVTEGGAVTALTVH